MIINKLLAPTSVAIIDKPLDIASNMTFAAFQKWMGETNASAENLKSALIYPHFVLNRDNKYFFCLLF